MTKQSEVNSRLDEMIHEFQLKTSLESWNHFVRGLQVPAELFPALMANRPELLKVVNVRDYTAAEVRVLLDVIANLIATNQALREHAHELSVLTKNWNADIKGLRRTAFKIHQFANFRRIEDDEFDDFE